MFRGGGVSNFRSVGISPVLPTVPPTRVAASAPGSSVRGRAGGRAVGESVGAAQLARREVDAGVVQVSVTTRSHLYITLCVCVCVFLSTLNSGEHNKLASPGRRVCGGLEKAKYKL